MKNRDIWKKGIFYKEKEEKSSKKRLEIRERLKEMYRRRKKRKEEGERYGKEEKIVKWPIG